MFGSYKLLNMVEFLAHPICETIQSMQMMSNWAYCRLVWLLAYAVINISY